MTRLTAPEMAAHAWRRRTSVALEPRNMRSTNVLSFSCACSAVSTRCLTLSNIVEVRRFAASPIATVSGRLLSASKLASSFSSFRFIAVNFAPSDSTSTATRDDDDDDEAALATKDLLLAQYESVHHAKGKWRIALKAGVVHVNGRDVPFSTAKAELQF
mmetsp:Transcript_7251/g.18804  ORF Transcript_7251/g.18804 Transcript_7251/m.18804 type:complete len:159 (-) Transcript_7251:52-528(-)